MEWYANFVQACKKSMQVKKNFAISRILSKLGWRNLRKCWIYVFSHFCHFIRFFYVGVFDERYCTNFVLDFLFMWHFEKERRQQVVGRYKACNPKRSREGSNTHAVTPKGLACILIPLFALSPSSSWQFIDIPDCHHHHHHNHHYHHQCPTGTQTWPTSQFLFQYPTRFRYQVTLSFRYNPM